MCRPLQAADASPPPLPDTYDVLEYRPEELERSPFTIHIRTESPLGKKVGRGGQGKGAAPREACRGGVKPYQRDHQAWAPKTHTGAVLTPAPP